ncbi:MAG: ABC transporter substrate-binding protein [Micrococcus sp.]|nr:ABC transporter substrate-binding protein [Micrococcus sp.]
MKKSASALRLSAVAAVFALGLTACGGNGNGGSEGTTSPAGDGETLAAAESYTIGINQLVSHPALDAASKGFQSAFDEADIEVNWDLQNAQGEVATATSIANTFNSNADMDLIAAIATPAAQATANAVQDKPVVFFAVTDPEAAGIVESVDAPGANVTGVSDRNPVKDQLQLLLDVKPDAKTVGIVWNSAETNSKSQVDQAKEAAAELGIEIKDVTITNSSEVGQGVQSLGDVDGIYVPTDNAVVSALEAVLQYGQDNSIPVISADTDSVERGALGTYGIDYEQHGKLAGEMAVKILRDDEDPGSMAVEYASEDMLELVVNPTAAESFGVEISQDVLDRADVVIED